MAAACALGVMGRNDVRPLLVRYLREEPSAELIEAVTPIADEECVVLVGRIARTMPHLRTAALDALETIEHPHASRLAAEIRVSSIRGSP
jgi:hypothetical protein